MLLEGHGRRRESTGIRREASSPKLRAKLKEQAEEVYHARMIQLARGRVGLPVVSDVTFQKYSEWYETHHVAKHRSAPRERVILAHLRDFFGSMRLNEITRSRWQEYETERLKTGVSINTVGRELALMKTALVNAVGDYIEVSPLAHVKRKTKKRTAKRTLTKNDEARLLEELHDDELRDIYLVAVGTLLRQQNVILLQRKQLHSDRLVIDTKTGPHQITLDGPTTLQRRVATVLRRRMPKTHAGYFFPKWAERFTRTTSKGSRDSETGGKPGRDSANVIFLKLFRRACTRAGIPWGLENGGVVWHSATRASGATRMIREHGIDIRTVQLLGNWSSLDQMAEYLGIDLTAPAASAAAGKRAKR